MTAYLRNSWYCAGWSADLSEKPVGIKIMGEEIVLFRTGDGQVSAISGRCPHRFAPLALGSVKGDLIECPYHGLQFDREGVCRLNPHGQGKIPPRANTRSYPAADQGGALWVWMGDPKLADTAEITELYFVGEPEKWAGVTGHLRLNADYQLVTDNLLDLTHATYLHPDTVGVDPDHSLGAALKFDFKMDGNVIHADYTFLNSPTTAMFKPFFPPERGDIYAFMRWEPASKLLLDLTATVADMPKEDGVHMPSAHFITPETDQTCHYFFAVSRSVELTDELKSRVMGEMTIKTIVEEDGPIIEQCQKMMGDADFFDLEPAVLETDIAGIQARRILAKLIKLEHSAPISTQAVQAA